MQVNLKPALEQLDLQLEVWALVEAHVKERGLEPGAAFDLLVCFAWAHARRDWPSTTTMAIVERMRRDCERCEAEHVRALAESQGAVLPFAREGQQ